MSDALFKNTCMFLEKLIYEEMYNVFYIEEGQYILQSFLESKNVKICYLEGKYNSFFIDFLDYNCYKMNGKMYDIYHLTLKFDYTVLINFKESEITAVNTFMPIKNVKYSFIFENDIQSFSGIIKTSKQEIFDTLI